MLKLSEQASLAASDVGLDPRLVELVKIRASQINGCASCLRMHTADAAALGETPERLAVLAAWWESQYFTAQEQAALVVAEQVTLTGAHSLAPARAVGDPSVLTEQELSAIAWVAIAINAWNRIAISSHYPWGPDPRQARSGQPRHHAR